MAQQQREPKSTAQSPWPVSKVSYEIKGWIDRLGYLWIEGELAQINTKPKWNMAFLTLRDSKDPKSLSLTCAPHVLTTMGVRVQEGDHVIVHGRPNYYEGRGSFSIAVDEIRHVGVGELLARIEALRNSLAAEGLFDPARKHPLPYLPQRIGLITGSESHAEKDVLEVAHRRWPQVQFRVIHTAVQGANTVKQVVAALSELDRDPTVDVIIIARGGGSVEDLMPFSEEALQRAVAAVHTPVVSAIGHEPDNPILDNVADVRAATPTDAAKIVVPDAAMEHAFISEARARMAGSLRGWVQRERQNIASLRSRPVLARPREGIMERREAIQHSVASMRRVIEFVMSRERSQVTALRAQVSALGPSATLARGYAVVQVVPRNGTGPEVVTSIEQAPPGSQLRIRVSDGSITAAGMQTTPAN